MTRSHFSFILSFSATVFALGLIIGCGGSGGSGSQAGAPAAADTTAVADTCAQTDTLMSESTAPPPSIYYLDTLVGQFVKGVADTLVVIYEPYSPNSYRGDRTLHSLGGSVGDLTWSGDFYFFCGKAGDVGGNGTEDLWVCPSNASGLACYRVITFSRGAWRSLTDDIGIDLSTEPDFGNVKSNEFSRRLSPVRASGKPGYLWAKTNMTANGPWGREGSPADTLLKIRTDGEEYLLE